MQTQLQKVTVVTLVLLFVLVGSVTMVSAALDPQVTNFGMTDATFTTYTPSSASSSGSTSCASGLKKDISQMFTYLLCLLDSGIIPLLISIALIIFLAGVVRFVGAGDNEEQRQGGRHMMIFGIIALFVMVSVWAFVNVLTNSFFGKNSEIQTLPKKNSSMYATE